MKANINEETKEMLFDLYYLIGDFYEQNLEWGDEFHRGKEKAYERTLEEFDKLFSKLEIVPKFKI